MRNVDVWVGKRIFQPIAIKLCHLLGINQYRLHSYIWLLVLLWLIYDGPGAKPMWADWVIYGLTILVAALWTVATALVPDRLSRSLFAFRMVWLIFFTMDVLGVVVTFTQGEPDWLFAALATRHFLVLIAEYATTITTLPPKKKKEKKTKTATKLAVQQ